MSKNLPESCREIVESQRGVITRSQALARGMSADAIAWRVNAERWRTLWPGVYLASSGEPSREATLWAAMRSAGAGAALSHQTAAELFKLADEPSSLIHITIPESRRVRAGAGIMVHRSSHLAGAVHPTLLPPRTRIEETVLDLAHQAAEFDAAFNVACAACQRGLTKPEFLAAAMVERKKMRWRAELREALGEVGSGVHSMLEYRYLHLVERPHRLPTAERQARVAISAGNRYLDNLYDGYRLCVELDGLQTHQEERRWQDQRRVNAIAVRGILTLRYGWNDVNNSPCQTAGEIAALLNRQGWPGTVRRCAPACTAQAVQARYRGISRADRPA
jgi:very-short-patch-repair endonuclease